MIPFSKPYRSLESYYRVAKALVRNQLTAGYEVCEFSRRFQDLIGGRVDVVIPTASGTAAIKLAMALIHRNESAPYYPKITYNPCATISPESWAGISNAISQCGGIIIAKGETDPNISYYVENYGFPIDVSDKSRYRVLDCAQSIIPATDGHFDFYVWSFHGSKQIAAGEGGALGINVARLPDIVSEDALTLAGYMQDKGYGYRVNNFRMSELSAAMVNGQLSCLDKIMSIRKDRFNQYNQLFGCYKHIPEVPWCYPVPLKSESYYMNTHPQIIEDIETRRAFDGGSVLLPVHEGVKPVHIDRIFKKLKFDIMG